MNTSFQPQRRSICLEQHDYSSAGAYYATICTETRGINWFGAVSSSDGVQLSPAGEMVRCELERLPQRFTNLEIDEFIVMPDHVHVIFILHAAPDLEPVQPVAPRNDADTSIRRGELNVRPAPHAERRTNPIQSVALNPNHPSPSSESESALGVRAVKGEHAVRPYANASARGGYVHPNGTQADSIGRIVQLFKTFTTQEYIKGVRGQGWPQFEKRFWERNYWERVIRDDAELEVRRAYIAGNPACHLEKRGG